MAVIAKISGSDAGAGSSSGGGEAASRSAPVDHDAINEQIIGGLDIVAEYEALGLVFISGRPRSSGATECYAIGRDGEQSSPSAWVNVNTGLYGDSSSGEKCSLWEFAAKHGGYADWQTARRHFAEKAGVEIPAAGGGGSSSGARPKARKSSGKGEKSPVARKPKSSSGNKPADVLIFDEWTPGNQNLARIWCAKHKPGTSLDAILAAGGRIAYYRSYWKDGEHIRGRQKVIALPCYDAVKLLDADPVAWQFWDIAGKPLERWAGKGKPTLYSKMLSCGPTAGTLMGRHAIERLMAARAAKKAAGAASSGASVESPAPPQPPLEIAWKVAGPSDMLALFTAIPPDRRDSEIVTTNASGETGEVPDAVAELFAIPGCRTIVVHDADAAGFEGLLKWAEALDFAGADYQCAGLPYRRRDKGGLDLRNWLAGVEDSPVEGASATPAGQEESESQSSDSCPFNAAAAA